MDWNWFFSSLAQSVAALVAIFAAFIITKIINSQGDFARKNTRLRELLSSSRHLREALEGRYFPYYIRNKLDEALESLNDMLDKETIPRTSEEYYDELDVPRFMARKEVIQRIDDSIRTHVPRTESSTTFPPSISLTSEMIRIRHESARQLRENVQKEEETINALIVDIKHQSRLTKLHLVEVENNPEASELVGYSIMSALLLFFIGVIYPLSFLPVVTNKPIILSFGAFFTILLSLKGVMLVTTSVIFCLIMGLFWRVNSSLIYAKDDLDKLRHATKIENYSKYLGVMETNIKEQSEWRKKRQAFVAATSYGAEQS